MRAFATAAFFQPGGFAELPEPEPGEGEVLVRVKAAGLNTTDLAAMAGVLKDYMEHRFPLIPGIDASGVVARVGPGVDTYREGDEVFGFQRRPLVGRGSLAELVAFPANGLQLKPASIAHHQAAVIPHSALTAAAAVDAAAVQPGARVALLGATGGVGSFATQLFAAGGAAVIAITLGEYADYARSLGAEDVVDYEATDPVETIRARHPDGIDAVVDLAGVAALMSSLADQVRAGGRVVSIVLPPDVERLSARGVEGILTSRWAAEHRLAELTASIVGGTLQLPAIQTFSFDDVEAAIALQSLGHVRGKLVVLMN